MLTLAPSSVGSTRTSPSTSALSPLLALFLLTWAATRFDRSRKQSLGVAEDKRGRNAAQVAANLGVAGLGAATALSYRLPDPFYAVLVVAVLAEATADTLASELGEVLGGPPFMITTLRRVAPGTDGAVSPAGTVAGTSGALLVVLVAMPALGLSTGNALCAGLGAIGGLFFDSLLRCNRRAPGMAQQRCGKLSVHHRCRRHSKCDSPSALTGKGWPESIETLQLSLHYGVYVTEAPFLEENPLVCVLALLCPGVSTF